MNKNKLKDSLIEILYKIDSYNESQLKQLEEFSDKFNEKIPVVDSVETDFDYVRFMLKNHEWQDAVDASFLCNKDSEAEKNLRARAIISTFGLDTCSNLKILDYGCGEGHVTKILSGFTHQYVMGYDIKKQWNDHHLLTDDINKARQFSPYDIVTLYDVLDHTEEEPVKILEFIRDNLIRSGGQIKIRFHPWCSRHGAHQYHQLNKSYIHLFFDEKELDILGVKNLPFTRKILNPKDYENIVNKLGMKIVHKQHHWQPAGWIYENNPRLRDLILRKHYPDKNRIDYSMIETTFEDYWLEKN